MVKGRQGLYLEAWKFSVYLGIPIIASVYYSDPDNQRYWADYWQYIKYPENPNTNVKDKIQEIAKEKEKQREQRLAYRQQLMALQASANRTNDFDKADESTSSLSSSGQEQHTTSWWRRAGGWLIGTKKGPE